MLFSDIRKERSQVAFVQTALWFIGEYGDLLLEPYDNPTAPSSSSSSSRNAKNKKKGVSSPTHFDAVQPSELVELLYDFQNDRHCSEETRMILLTTALKLSDRLDSTESTESTESNEFSALSELPKIVAGFEASQELELAQRASEWA